MPWLQNPSSFALTQLFATMCLTIASSGVGKSSSGVEGCGTAGKRLVVRQYRHWQALPRGHHATAAPQQSCCQPGNRPAEVGLARLPAYVSGESARIRLAAGSSTETDAPRGHRYDHEIRSQFDAQRDASGQRQDCRNGDGRRQKRNN
jgi:hypothetical protein